MSDSVEYQVTRVQQFKKSVSSRGEVASNKEVTIRNEISKACRVASGKDEQLQI